MCGSELHVCAPHLAVSYYIQATGVAGGEIGLVVFLNGTCAAVAAGGKSAIGDGEGQRLAVILRGGVSVVEVSSSCEQAVSSTNAAI